MSKKRTEKQPQKQQNQETPADDWLDDEECVQPKQPTLRFSPTAWAKLLYFRDKSDNEVGGFAVTEPDDLLSVTEFFTVKQEVSWVSVKFDDEAVGQFFDEQVDLGRKPEQFARLWLHTHPGECPNPSATDEATFKRVFGGCQWAVMCVVAQDGSVYARLSFNVGPGGQVLIPVEVDYSKPFAGSDHEGWDKEYETNVRACHWQSTGRTAEERQEASLDGSELPCDFLEEFESLDPAQRQILLDELADRPDLWDESEVIFL